MTGKNEVTKQHPVMTIQVVPQADPPQAGGWREVADYLKISVHTVYNMVRRGQIPCIKVGRQWRFRQADIYTWAVRVHR